MKTFAFLTILSATLLGACTALPTSEPRNSHLVSRQIGGGPISDQIIVFYPGKYASTKSQQCRQCVDTVLVENNAQPDWSYTLGPNTNADVLAGVSDYMTIISKVSCVVKVEINRTGGSS